MKKKKALRIKFILFSILLVGLVINIAAWNIVAPAEFGIATGFVFILPSTIILLATLIYIVKSNFGKKKVFALSLAFTLVALIIPSILSVLVVREINKKIQLSNNPKMKAFIDFDNNNIPPIENGLWYYPNSEKPVYILSFLDGKNHGEHKSFNPKTNELEEVKFYNTGKLDSIYQYFQNKLRTSFHSQNIQEKFDTVKYYQYNKDQISQVVIFHGKTGEKDTILLSE